VRGGRRLAESLAAHRDEAMLYRSLTRLRQDVPILPGGVDELRWSGPGADLHAACAELDAKDVPERMAVLISRPVQE